MLLQNNKGIALILGHLLDQDVVDQSLRKLGIYHQSYKARSKPVRRRRIKIENSGLQIIVTESLFAGNKIWSSSGFSTEGLVSVQDGAALELTDSIFIGNSMHSSNVSLL